MFTECFQQYAICQESPILSNISNDLTEFLPSENVDKFECSSLTAASPGDDGEVRLHCSHHHQVHIQKDQYYEWYKSLYLILFSLLWLQTSDPSLAVTVI